MSYQTHYSNPTNLVPVDVSLIGAAAKSIDFAAYSLTEPAVIQALVKAATDGVQVRLYLDRSELEAEARGNPTMPSCPLHELFGIPNVSILVKHSMVLMHLKSYCVDTRVLRDGSANFSPIGESEQDNSLTVTDDTQAIANFTAKFNSMWSRQDNQSVQAAIETSVSYGAHHGKSH